MLQILQKNTHGDTVKSYMVYIHQQVDGRLSGVYFKAVHIIVEQVKRLHKFRHDGLHLVFVFILDQYFHSLPVTPLLHYLFPDKYQAGFQIRMHFHDSKQGFPEPGRVRGVWIC